MEQMEQLEIAYQNKDITSKVLADGSVAIADYESGYGGIKGQGRRKSN